MGDQLPEEPTQRDYRIITLRIASPPPPPQPLLSKGEKLGTEFSH